MLHYPSTHALVVGAILRFVSMILVCYGQASMRVKPSGAKWLDAKDWVIDLNIVYPLVYSG